MSNKIKYTLLILLILPTFVNAQKWRKNRKEIIVGAGTTGFLGDLGGGSTVGNGKVGRKISLKDFRILDQHMESPWDSCLQRAGSFLNRSSNC